MHRLCIAYASPMHCLCIAYALPMHRLCIAYALPMHLEVPYVARPIRRFLPWNGWVLVVWNPVLPSWWCWCIVSKGLHDPNWPLFLGLKSATSYHGIHHPTWRFIKVERIGPGLRTAASSRLNVYIVYLINGGHASSVIPMPEDNVYIYIYIYIYIQWGLHFLCLGYLGITRQHVCYHFWCQLNTWQAIRKAFEVGPCTGPAGPPLHAQGAIEMAMLVMGTQFWSRHIHCCYLMLPHLQDVATGECRCWCLRSSAILGQCLPYALLLHLPIFVAPHQRCPVHKRCLFQAHTWTARGAPRAKKNLRKSGDSKPQIKRKVKTSTIW